MNSEVISTGLKNSGGILAEQYSLGLLDLDGVVYRGKNPVEHAAEGVTQAEEAGMFISYTTNNAARSQKVIADHIASFGVSVTPHQIITSAIVAARIVAHAMPNDSRILVIGSDHLHEEIYKNGLTTVDSAQDHPDAVVQGWWPGVSWNELAQVAYAVEQGAKYFVTNRDLTIPRELGIAPGNGSLVNAVVTATGVQPVSSAGKPESAMYDEERAMNASKGHTLVPVRQSLPVGDRLDTDIEAANRGGYDSLVVLTGVATPSQLMTAIPVQRPTYISADLRGLVQEHQAPKRQSEDCYTLNDMSARVVEKGTKVVVTDATTNHGFEEQSSISSSSALGSLDALRAACALTWELADRGRQVTAMKLPEFNLSEGRAQ